MPWAWTVAWACLDNRTGQVLNWPYPTKPLDYNQPVLDAAYAVWRVVHLFHKPQTRPGPRGSVESNWTPEDVDMFAWLEEEAKKRYA